MGATKLSIHTAEQIELSEFAKVLAHPARISILQYISRQENCICGDIVDEIGLSQPTISQHLQVIRKAGLLKGTFEGKSICYCLNMEKFKEFQENIQSFFTNTAAQCC
ncbi:ArsR/SmtB family transcription factor [Constantimarinum furrinae]|uniref:ArsR family transcriptional regulator n=1 Tax=Constantimarinum furrinae TaxID=2562285 RepID=A0A7G8PTL7_9FLAO|nr:metalloregulator ArsR/SmtB family transcription factor [Constantimarinum furrinae]QNJ97683.1 ArsR family transcriptional regulator [Constantimarinum furrinae]